MSELFFVLGIPLAGGLALALTGHRSYARNINVTFSLGTFLAACFMTAHGISPGPVSVSYTHLVPRCAPICPCHPRPMRLRWWACLRWRGFLFRWRPWMWEPLLVPWARGVKCWSVFSLNPLC